MGFLLTRRRTKIKEDEENMDEGLMTTVDKGKFGRLAMSLGKTA